MRRTEILVHVSAPSRAKDDARYHALVEAAAAFEPVSRHNVFPKQKTSLDTRVRDDGSTSSTGPPAPDQEGRVNSGDELENIIPICQSPELSNEQFLATDQVPTFVEPDEVVSISSTELPPAFPNGGRPCSLHQDPSPSFQVIDRIVDPKENALRSPESQRSRVSDSLETPLSVIPDSQPQPPPRETDARLLEHAPVAEVQVESSFLIEVSPAVKRRRLDTTLSSSSAEDGTPDLRIPSSFPDSEKDIENSSQERAFSTPRVAPAQRSTTGEPPPQTRGIPPKFYHSLSLDVLPIALHPPPPPVSTEAFETHITPTLRMLAKRLKGSRTYQPLRQTRESDKLERGFWYVRIDIMDQNEGAEGGTAQNGEEKKRQNGPYEHRPTDANQWSLSFFTRFWSFLTDFIVKEGRAGWGVWCILEKASTNETSNKPAEQPEASNNTAHQDPPYLEEQGTTRRSLTLKVYTWGEIIPHVYLLLFLASERRIRGMGAQWKDGMENTVIEMP